MKTFTMRSADDETSLCMNCPSEADESLLAQALRSTDQTLIRAALNEPPDEQSIRLLNADQLAYLIDQLCTRLVNEGIPGVCIQQSLAWLRAVVKSGHVTVKALWRIKRICDNRSVPLNRAKRLKENIYSLLEKRKKIFESIDNGRTQQIPNMVYVDHDE
ncbi:hypothetical protein ACOME3_000152 [Neoechinorhynchus agilis]